jgi:hypothetical protein
MTENSHSRALVRSRHDRTKRKEKAPPVSGARSTMTNGNLHRTRARGQ